MGQQATASRPGTDLLRSPRETALAASAVVVAALDLGWIAVGVQVVLIVCLLAVERYASPIIDRWRRGAQGEEHVGAILDAMSDDGWFTIHDGSVGRGNVDHILIGPAGIFTVETKSHGGRINAREPRMLKQAYAESKAVERIVGMKVEPLLVFSRAYLTPAVTRRTGVMILPARMLHKHLGRRAIRLTSDEAAMLHLRLAAAVA